MKKFVITILVMLMLVLVTYSPADELRTRVGSYQTIYTTTGTTTESLTAATDYVIPSPLQDDSFDLMSMSNSVGGVTVANGVVITASAAGTADATFTVSYYGLSDGGTIEFICSIVYTLGDAVISSGRLWAGTSVVTDSHTNEIKSGGGSPDEVARNMWDMTGFRRIRPVVTAVSGDATAINIFMRVF